MFQLLIWMDNSKPSYSYNVLSLAAIISCLLAQNYFHPCSSSSSAYAWFQFHSGYLNFTGSLQLLELEQFGTQQKWKLSLALEVAALLSSCTCSCREQTHPRRITLAKFFLSLDELIMMWLMKRWRQWLNIITIQTMHY